jgi:hypothetical protein
VVLLLVSANTVKNAVPMLPALKQRSMNFLTLVNNTLLVFWKKYQTQAIDQRAAWWKANITMQHLLLPLWPQKVAVLPIPEEPKITWLQRYHLQDSMYLNMD